VKSGTLSALCSFDERARAQESEKDRQEFSFRHSVNILSGERTSEMKDNSARE
jgi:hypothetical protein